MTLTLSLRTADCTPFDLRGLTPVGVSNLPLDRLLRLPVRSGNLSICLGDAIVAEGDPSDESWRLVGDWSTVHWVGAGMDGGEIHVEGSVGRHAGAAMCGGTLTVGGNAGDGLGAEMAGGLIRARGHAGHHAAGAGAGSQLGMRGGIMLIDGSAGDWLGERMRRGLIAVAGDAGSGLAAEMFAGTILVWGQTAGTPGVGMRRGTLGLFGASPSLPATFRTGGAVALPMWPLMERELQRHGFPKALPATAALQLVHGDAVHGGRGEVLMAV